MRVEEYSTFFDVPLLRAGTFVPRNTEGQSVTYTEEEIQQMATDSNEALPYLQESIETGQYRGNEQIQLDRPIPGFVNIVHQDYLPNEMREAMKDVVISFGHKFINGVTWLTGTIKNIPQEWAKLIKDKFPFRSVEVLSDITNPDTGKAYPKLVRSIGFLDFLTRPAVGGQSPEFAVEFASENSSIIVLVSDVTTLQPQGEKHMEETKKVNAPEKPGENVSIAEFQEAKTQIAEMQAKIEAVEEQKARIAAALVIEQKARENNEIEMYCKTLIHEHQASPAFIDLVKPLLSAADTRIVELAEGKTTQRQELQEVFRKILTMKREDVVSVPLGEFAKAQHQTPESAPLSVEDRQAMRVAEFAEEAKTLVKHPDNQNEVFQAALGLALEHYGDTL